jgi:tRNA (cmo5U34)-methyltransferase
VFQQASWGKDTVIDSVSKAHFPENPEKFEFDSEVASVFDDMARRSIPLYEELHRFAAMLAMREYFAARAEGRPFLVMDVGASTGQFFRALWAALNTKPENEIAGLEAIAIDTSPHMLKRIKEGLPHVKTLCMQAEDIPDRMRRETIYDERQFDFVTALYVFQFIPISWGARAEAITSVADMLRPGGVMVAANKERMSDRLEAKSTHSYHGFRMQNGYTAQEIAAKTKALANSMWTEPNDAFRNYLSTAGMGEVEEVFRWLQFAAYVAVKQDRFDV